MRPACVRGRLLTRAPREGIEGQQEDACDVCSDRASGACRRARVVRGSRFIWCCLRCPMSRWPAPCCASWWTAPRSRSQVDIGASKGTHAAQCLPRSPVVNPAGANPRLAERLQRHSRGGVGELDARAVDPAPVITKTGLLFTHPALRRYDPRRHVDEHPDTPERILAIEAALAAVDGLGRSSLCKRPV